MGLLTFFRGFWEWMARGTVVVEGRKRETTILNADVAWLIASRQMPARAASRFETPDNVENDAPRCPATSELLKSTHMYLDWFILDF